MIARARGKLICWAQRACRSANPLVGGHSRLGRTFTGVEVNTGAQEAADGNQTPTSVMCVIAVQLIVECNFNLELPLFPTLSRDQINTILRKKKRPDRMVVTKTPMSDEPKMSVEDIKNLEKNLEDKLNASKMGEKTDVQVATQTLAAQAAQSFDFLAYQSKLESMLRGLEPTPPEVKYFKYELPIPNIDPGFRGTNEIADILRPLPTTPNENLWNSLPGVTAIAFATADSSYEEFEDAIEKRFNFEVDMYGDKENVAKFQEQMIETFGEDILPIEKLSNEKYMLRVRECFTLNLNMPGAMETVDPNRFLPDLRPVEEMRYTPFVPISEKTMDEFRKRQELYHLIEYS